MLIGGLDPGEAAGYVVLLDAGGVWSVYYAGTKPPAAVHLNLGVCEGQFSSPTREVSRNGKKIRTSVQSGITTPFGAGYQLGSWDADRHLVLKPAQHRSLALTSGGLSKQHAIGQCRRIFRDLIPEEMPDDVFEAGGLALAGVIALRDQAVWARFKRNKRGYWYLPEPKMSTKRRKSFRVGC